MSTNGLKSSTLHPYQRSVFPFWRRPENASLYSEATKLQFELDKISFEEEVKYHQWSTK